MSPTEMLIDELQAVRAELAHIKGLLVKYKPDLKPVAEVQQELRIKHRTNLYAWLRKKGIPVEHGLVDINQVYAFWEPRAD